MNRYCSSLARLTLRGLLVGAISLAALAGCGPSFEELRQEGQRAAADGQWGAARGVFADAAELQPNDAENLHDQGVCSMILARRLFEESNETAAMREVDRAIDYYDRSIVAHPGYRPSLLGKKRALELKGQFEEALRTAHWAAEYVGPSAEQQIWLAEEYERRGDMDNALLRLRQGLAMEPENPAIHKAIGLFHMRSGNRDVAVRALLHSLRLDPTQADVANALRSMGEPVPAVEEGPP